MSATTIARDLEAKIAAEGADWPHDLKQLAHNALNALKHIDRPDNRSDLVQEQQHKYALAAFEAAYGKFLENQEAGRHI